MPQFCPISCRKTPAVAEYELDRRLNMQRIEDEERIRSRYRDNTRTVIVKHEVVAQQPDCTQDLILKCQDCGGNFVFTVGEQQFYKSKGFTIPKRCKACRDAKKKNGNSTSNAVSTQNTGSSQSNGSPNEVAGSIARVLTTVLNAIKDNSSDK